MLMMYGQLIRSKFDRRTGPRFGAYDYGAKANEAAYHSATPPEYLLPPAAANASSTAAADAARAAAAFAEAASSSTSTSTWSSSTSASSSTSSPSSFRFSVPTILVKGGDDDMVAASDVARLEAILRSYDGQGGDDGHWDSTATAATDNNNNNNNNNNTDNSTANTDSTSGTSGTSGRRSASSSGGGGRRKVVVGSLAYAGFSHLTWLAGKPQGFGWFEDDMALVAAQPAAPGAAYTGGAGGAGAGAGAGL